MRFIELIIYLIFLNIYIDIYTLNIFHNGPSGDS